MAGRPLKRAMIESIEGAGGVAKLLERVSNGEKIIDIAEALGVSRSFISGLLNSPEHREALRNARREAASGLAEEALQIADRAKVEDVQVAKLRVDTRRWMAGKWDREMFGEQKGTQIQINLGQLHLDALKRRPTVQTPEPQNMADTLTLPA